MLENEKGREDLEHHQNDISIHHGDKGPTPSSTNDEHVSVAPPPPQKEVRQPPSGYPILIIFFFLSSKPINWLDKTEKV